MGQGQIRKGFFFYFGLFVLLIVAIFCICLVIMMFNPGKTVLWMQYFTANEHIVVSQTSDGEVDIDMAFIQTNVDTIEINCTSYAEVIVQRNQDEDYKNEGIHIINNAKGFQGASGAVHFDYDVKYSNKVLTINISEPNGFLYFSKDIKVVLASYTDWDNNFDHINLIVNTVDGDVNIGNSGLNPQDVKLAGLTVNAKQSGDIVLGDSFDTTLLQNLSLTTTKGNVASHNSIAYGNKDYIGLTANCDTKISTETGRIELGLLNVEDNDLTISCQTGSVAIDFVKAASSNVVCKRGTFDFGTVDGNLSYVGAASDTMIMPYIMADYITGDFVLQGYDKAEPEIYINRIDGQLQIFADNGKLDVNQAYGAVEIVSDGKLKSDLIVAENNVSQINIETTSGNVDLAFLGQFQNATVKTDSGKIVVRVVSGIVFESNTYENKSDVEESAQNHLDNEKITVSIELLDGGYDKNSFVVDGNDGVLNVYTNNSVEYILVAKTDLIG